MAWRCFLGLHKFESREVYNHEGEFIHLERRCVLCPKTEEVTPTHAYDVTDPSEGMLNRYNRRKPHGK